MKKLLSHIRPYLTESILGPLFKLFEAALELVVPLIMADIIDHGIETGDTAYVIRKSIELLLHGLAGLICSLIAQYFAARASVGFTASLKHSLFQHIQSLSNPDIDRIGTSTMVGRLTSDMDRIQSGLNLTLRLLLRSPFVVFGAAIMAFTVDVKTALVFLAVIPLLSLVVFGIMLITMPLYQKVQGQTDTVLSHVRENHTGSRVIRAFCREEQEVSEFEADNARLTLMQKQVGKISALMNPITYVMINLAIVALLQLGAVQVNVGALTQGEVVAQYNYLSLILTELIKMANLIISITKAVACLRRVQSVLEEPVSIVGADSLPTEDSSAPAVEFRHVSMSYSAAGRRSLSDINFRIGRGETFGIIGGTGSGKSTLANLMNRGYDATSGTVLINGVDVKQYPLSVLRGKIGTVPQNPLLFSGSIRENIKWGKQDATEEEIKDAVRDAQAENIVARSEQGLDAPVEQGGRNLSGGQRQRLTIARALVRHPEILILDDSTSALDYETAKNLLHALHSLPYHPTIVLISQRTSAIRSADQILVLEEGELVGCGKHADLLQTCAVYREIHESQLCEEVRAK